MTDTSTWLASAQAQAAAWTDRTLHAVQAAWPYPPDSGVRMRDWVTLVAHVSHTRAEDHTQTADRLATYVHTYQERYQRTLTPAKLKESQTDG